MMLLVLGAQDVRQLLPYRECADVMRHALAARARGQVYQPLRTMIRPPGTASLMALMPCYLPGASLPPGLEAGRARPAARPPGEPGEPGYGLKAICIFPGNPALGLDAHQGGVLVSDSRTGEPLALVNASALTEVRTAAHVNAVGACFPEARELDTGTMAEAALFVDSRESAEHEAGDFLIAAAEGAIGRDHIRAEIGDVVTGAAQGRRDDREITVFESLGLAVEDLAAAAHAYRQACERGLGTWVEF